jgi:hypothetical protein
MHENFFAIHRKRIDLAHEGIKEMKVIHIKKVAGTGS